jgi:hypothetical protein
VWHALPARDLTGGTPVPLSSVKNKTGRNSGSVVPV